MRNSKIIVACLGLILLLPVFYWVGGQETSLSCKDCNILSRIGVGGLTSGIVIIGVFQTGANRIMDILIPRTEVEIEDDKGVIAKAYLSRAVTANREIKSGERVRLHCTGQRLSGSNDSYCELLFSGFDPGHSSYLSQHPDFGKIPNFGVTLDSAGVPDPKVLEYIH